MTQVTKKDETTLAIMKPEAKEMQEIFKENLAGGTMSRFDLETIKVPGGGETKWVINDIDGSKMVQSFSGIIVKAHATRAYWKPEYSEDGKEVDNAGGPPDCASDDGLAGHGDPGGSCAGCKLSKWDTGKNGKGQACKSMRTLYILTEGSYLPTVMNCPPTSNGNVQKYFTSLTMRAHRFSDVLTTFSLDKDRSDTGFEFARVIPVVERVLTDDEKKAVRAFVTGFASAIEQKVDTSDYS